MSDSNAFKESDTIDITMELFGEHLAAEFKKQCEQRAKASSFLADCIAWPIGVAVLACFCYLAVIVFLCNAVTTALHDFAADLFPTEEPCHTPISVLSASTTPTPTHP